MYIFLTIFLFVIAQRLIELIIAKKNEQWMKDKGAKEYGQEHYKYMVLMHMGFFIFLFFEVLITGKPIHRYFYIFLFIFLLVQLARVWVITTLGKYWNTKIIVLPGILVVKKGPFQYIRHPNYLIVTIELLVLPLMFQAYFTLIIYFILNQWMLAVRIKVEEQVLREHTNYKERFN